MGAPIYHRILIPLDGSPLSSSTISRLATFLDQPELSVTLFTVIDEVDEKAARVDVRSEQEFAGSKEHLLRTGAPLAERRISVSMEISSGDPADEILREMERGDYDLVAMSTLGWGGLGKSRLGSVTYRVLQSCPIPLLLLHPLGQTITPDAEYELHRSISFSRILVPLDGSENAEEILPAAQRMASAFHSSLILFQAVPHEPDASHQAEEYLKEKSRGLAADRTEVTLLLRVGDPAEQLLSVVREYDIGIIAIATHGHTGILGTHFGSVAGEVLSYPGIPTLIVQNRAFRKPMPVDVLDARRRLLKPVRPASSVKRATHMGGREKPAPNLPKSG